MSTARATVRILVDTDMGVDDAAALAWLLVTTEPAIEVVGVSTVFGNSSVENAASNVAALLHALGRSGVPVALGAAAPRARPRSGLGSFLHGKDGLWGFPQRRPLAEHQRDVARFYRDVARAHPGTILLTLGPLTNLAAVAAADPDALRGFSRIVVLGGAKIGGSITPVAEANFWHDPESAAEVLSSALPITLVLRDAHLAVTLEDEGVRALCAADSPAGRFLSGPVSRYAAMASALGRGPLSLPDVVAAVYAAEPSIGLDVRPACVKVITDGDPLTRGQSIIGLSASEKISMLASLSSLEAAVVRATTETDFDLRAHLGAIVARGTHDASVVLKVAADRVRGMFMRALAGREGSAL